MVKNQEIYCRRLGHAITLGYCAHESMDLPCRLIYQCWQGRIPIHDYLLTMYSEAQLRPFQGPREPASKLASIVDIINQAQGSRQ